MCVEDIANLVAIDAPKKGDKYKKVENKSDAL